MQAGEIIRKELEKNPSFMVVKPSCPSCNMAKALLKKNGVEFQEINYAQALDLVNEIKEQKEHMTFPMIFLNKKFIGGYDKLKIYFEDEENIENAKNYRKVGSK